MYKTLIFSYYVDANEERDKELIHCFEKNLKIGFDCIVVFSEVDIDILYKKIDNNALENFNGRMLFKEVKRRPTYNDFFEASKLSAFDKEKEKLFFITNSDIYFEDLYKVEDFYRPIDDKQNTILALSRWDVQKDGSSKYVDRIDSQDVWIFYDSIVFSLKEDFTMGVPGCDNRLAHELRFNNYNILNASDTIRVYHYHLSNIRRYVDNNEVHEAFINNESKRISGPYYLFSQYEKLLKDKEKKKVISFSLYGNDPKYCVGAIKNAKLAKYIYPDWVCRFYISKNVDLYYVNELKNMGNTEIVIVNEFENNNGMFWRFLPICDTSVDVMISRDCDSRLCMREKYAVDDWVSSGNGFHIMRDHPYHHFKIMGGMFGVKNGCLPNFVKLLNNCKNNSAYNDDQFFLQNVIYPIVKENSTIHDVFVGDKPFPTLRSSNKKFVGEIYDENDNRHPHHYKLI
jgi:hypothetical protein